MAKPNAKQQAKKKAQAKAEAERRKKAAQKKRANQKKKKGAYANKPVKIGTEVVKAPIVKPTLTAEQEADFADRQESRIRELREMNANYEHAKLDALEQVIKSVSSEKKQLDKAKWSASGRGLGMSSIRDEALFDIQSTEHQNRMATLASINRIKTENEIAAASIREEENRDAATKINLAAENADRESRELGYVDTTRKKAADVKREAIRKAAKTGNYKGIAMKDQRNYMGGKRWVRTKEGIWKLNDKGYKYRKGKKTSAVVEQGSNAAFAAREKRIAEQKKNNQNKGPGQNSGGNKGGNNGRR